MTKLTLVAVKDYDYNNIMSTPGKFGKERHGSAHVMW